MTEFNYLREKARMVKANKTGHCTISCTSCPLYMGNNDTNYACLLYEKACPNEATAIVKKWAEEHPRMTNKDKFKEVFGNATYTKEGKCENKYDCFLEIPCSGCDWWNEEYIPPEREENK